ncbi:hypothetical protein KVT40_002248 [Elsinoe batatas]|uniref:WLM domain-containing protein n=1 Tax=Elsinoe batatas TaxID=2601811 RepID=A0A8K0PM40_9PEZI|nr:hypothetical protein KVT40_002248 [Elsinoe batatas]
MPFTTLRLNEKHLHPNPRITFIKPLPSLSTTPLAELFLQKIAAQCYPIMKAHSLSITTLEEFPPNREFWGRNFNGGEVIQLVLRRMPTRRWDDGRGQFVSTSDLGENGVIVRGNQGRLDPHSTGFVAERDGQDEGWLGFKAVQAVMMHELAHCIEMNHAKAFWKVRNIYMEHLKVLWREGYTGEGVWGRGQMLEDGRFETGGGGGLGEVRDLCGGAYRGRGRRVRKKKGKEKVTYQERKRRKVEKTESKFGKGQEVGESESLKFMLEGKFSGSKPTVAKSKRGRELRAAAALARFERAKVEEKKEVEIKDEEETESEGSETESEGEDHSACLVDAEGKQVKDAKGHGLYRVCEDTDVNKDEDAKNELDELEELVYRPKATTTSVPSGPSETPAANGKKPEAAAATVDNGDDETEEEDEACIVKPSTPLGENAGQASSSNTNEPVAGSCPICSLENDPGSATCMACAHVLDTRQIKGAWQCTSEGCKASGYINAGDAGRCGICGQAKGT